MDGEGVRREDGTHDYVALTCGAETLRCDKPSGRLEWSQILEFLYDCFEKQPNSIYVGYYLGYDFTQWIRTFPEERAEMLLSKRGIARRKRKGKNPVPFPVYLGNETNGYQWEIDILSFKKFKLRRGIGKEPSKKNPNPHSWMHICDVGSFFQQSFVKTLEEYVSLGVVSTDEVATIKRGKDRRATATLDDEMIEYNLLECELLARVMTELRKGFRHMGLELRKDKWFGPGQAAQLWMTHASVPTSESVRAAVPNWARAIARATYFGGWFEIYLHGLVPGSTWEYDINSAYPHQIAQLPCLLHGKWECGPSVSWTQILELAKDATLCAVHGKVTGTDPHAGTMPHRDKHGKVLRPLQTIGWYWLHELQAAMRAGLVDVFEPIPTAVEHEQATSWLTYHGCGCEAPIRAMQELYLERLKVGKKTAQGKAYKLTYNSAYGKMAQSVGTPKFANAIYASLTTAGARTRILEAVATHPCGTRDLVMVATDGVYFRTPHPTLELNPEKLGSWSVSEKKNLCLFMPGLYWDDKNRKAILSGKPLEQNEEALPHSRGVPSRYMAERMLQADGQFERFDGITWPAVTIPYSFSMVTCKQALQRHDWEQAGAVSSAEKTINADPSNKRATVYRDGDIWRSTPHEQCPLGIESIPYERAFGDELEARDLLLTPDGTANSLMAEWLGSGH